MQPSMQPRRSAFDSREEKSMGEEERDGRTGKRWKVNGFDLEWEDALFKLTLGSV